MKQEKMEFLDAIKLSLKFREVKKEKYDLSYMMHNDHCLYATDGSKLIAINCSLPT